jgi:uncharacterized protein YjbI with pentapeptide repeats
MATPTTQIDSREIIKQDVAGLCFEGIHFDGKFSDSTFRQCIFHRCRLDRVLMGKSRWIESRFDGSKLVVWFDDSIFERCSFRETSFQGLRGEYGGVRARFVGCDFTGATLKAVKLRACKFENCDFLDTRFIDCDLRGAMHNGKALENAA